MKRFVLLFTLLVPFVAIAQSATTHDQKARYLLGAVQDMRIVPNFKSGLEADRSTPVSSRVQAVVAMSDDVLAKLYVEVLAPKMTLQEAKVTYQFYSSPAGKALIAIQSKDPANTNPNIHLPPSQVAVINAYMSTPTAKKLGALTSSRATWAEFAHKIEIALNSK